MKYKVGDIIDFISPDWGVNVESKGKILYIDIASPVSDCFFIETPLTEETNRTYQRTKVFHRWRGLLPKEVSIALAEDKGYLWLEESEIIRVYSDLECLIDNIDNELSN